MKFYLSTIADVTYIWNEEEQSSVMKYIHRTGPIAKEAGIGLELAEFCISDNCIDLTPVMSFFEENVNDYTSDLVFHAPFNELLPHAIDPEIVSLAKKRYKFSYDLCEKYGCKKMIAHANFIPTVYFEEWFIPRQIEFWSSFLEENKGDCVITLENVMEDHSSMLLDIVKGVNDERLRICLDVGHANLHPEKPLKWIENCGEYISHLHIHNNNGPVSSENKSRGDLHNPLGEGEMDMKYILETAQKCCAKDITATVECFQLEECVNWLKENTFI